jgi:hypothetical protein
MSGRRAEFACLQLTLRDERGRGIVKKLELGTTDLAQFTGTEQWYRHALNGEAHFTDGAKHVADRAGAYWLLDEIALIQLYDKRVGAERFQVWKLNVNTDMTAELGPARMEVTTSST